MIEIALTKAQLDFMREAMQDKFDAFMDNLDDAEDNFDAGEMFSLNAQQVQAMKNAGVWDDPVKRLDVIQKYRNEALRKHLDEHVNHHFAWKAVTPEEVEKPKKPHWTQTAKGKKILAARKKAKK